MVRTHTAVRVILALGPMLYAQSSPPPTRKQPVTDVYHAVKVIDDYRWLEDWSNPETQAWSNAQNTYARKYLDAIPGRAALRNEIAARLSKQAGNFAALIRAGDKLFALRFQPPKEQRFLVAL